MARTPAPNSIDALILEAMEGVVARASKAIAKAIARLAAERLEEELAAGVAAATSGRTRRRAVRGARPARQRAEITRWAADRRARRVPTFVIEMTGLKTKKAIVAKYGDGVVFEKGKNVPKAR